MLSCAVGLRKEPVDWNPQRSCKLVERCESGSARSLWIEITSYITYLPVLAVGLRKEPVDWNNSNSPTIIRNRVGLRKEPVDWNTSTTSTSTTRCVGLRKEPVDWNAIILKMSKIFYLSGSARSLWIEIFSFLFLRLLVLVGLRKEPVDWNFIYNIFSVFISVGLRKEPVDWNKIIRIRF